MKTTRWKAYLGGILLTEAAGWLVGWLNRAGIQAYQLGVVKPPLTPPAWVFPVVWVVLYALMGIGAARMLLARPSSMRAQALLVYAAQLVVNLLWVAIFFQMQNYGFALFWITVLWLLIVCMIYTFWMVDRLAAVLQIPYLIWVSFAIYLNLGVWALN